MIDRWDDPMDQIPDLMKREALAEWVFLGTSTPRLLMAFVSEDDDGKYLLINGVRVSLAETYL